MVRVSVKVTITLLTHLKKNEKKIVDPICSFVCLLPNFVNR